MPTERDIAFYREHGYHVSKKILDDELIDRAVAAVDRFHAGDCDHDFSLPEGGWAGWKKSDGDVLRKIDFAIFWMDVLRELALHPMIGRNASILAGSPRRAAVG